MNVLELALARRAAIAAEIDRLDAFLDRAAILLDGVQDRALPDELPENVISFRRRVSDSGSAATAYGTGA